MLTKETLLAKKHFKNSYTKKNNNSHSIKKLLAVYPPDAEYDANYFENHDPYGFFEDRAEAKESAMRDLYRRNNNIITILSHNVNNIQQNIQLLKKQQDLAIIGSSFWTDEKEMKELEKQLRKSFKAKKLPRQNE
jgi:hypothetical protein